MPKEGFDINMMPKSVLCYICGWGYGTKSIQIHLKSCRKSWEEKQLLLEKKDRRPVPQDPKGWNQLINKESIDKKELEQINNIAFEEYQDQGLIWCEFCQRTFNQEAFMRHQKCCTKENPMNQLKDWVQQKSKPDNLVKHKSVEIEQQESEIKNNNQKNKNKQLKIDQNSVYEEQKQNLKECQYCSRKFAQDWIEKHESVCEMRNQKKFEKTIKKQSVLSPNQKESKNHKENLQQKVKQKWQIKCTHCNEEIDLDKLTL